MLTDNRDEASRHQRSQTRRGCLKTFLLRLHLPTNDFPPAVNETGGWLVAGWCRKPLFYQFLYIPLSYFSFGRIYLLSFPLKAADWFVLLGMWFTWCDIFRRKREKLRTILTANNKLICDSLFTLRLLAQVKFETIIWLNYVTLASVA